MMLYFPQKKREDYTRGDIEPRTQKLLRLELGNNEVALGRLSDYSSFSSITYCNE